MIYASLIKFDGTWTLAGVVYTTIKTPVVNTLIMALLIDSKK